MSVELKIEKVAHGGVFVARPEGKVVFVEDVLLKLQKKNVEY